VVIIDACRNNPFTDNRGRAIGGGRGLAVINDVPGDLFYMFSTAPGTIASDGEGGRNSPFAAAFLKHINSTEPLVVVASRITGETLRLTNNTQRPFQGGSIVSDVLYTLGGKSAPQQAVTPALVPRPAVTPAPAPPKAVTPAPAPRPAATVQPAATPQDAAKVYKIGDTGPAGGWIFYDKGSFSDGWRYLEAAPRDAGKGAWGLFKKKIVGSIGTAVGTGKRNTQLILEALRQAGETGRAAQLCAAFEAGGFKDWFFPSKDELDLMYKNLKAQGLGNFQNKPLYYWSSSETGNDGAWLQNFKDFYPQNEGKYLINFKDNPTHSVRAIRAF
jgi:hypothetical protein